MNEGSAVERLTRLVRADRALAAGVDEDLLIMNVDDGRFYRLDDIGRCVWGLIEAPCSFGDLCAGVIQEYDTDLETCEPALARLIEKLCDAKLVEQVAG